VSKPRVSIGMPVYNREKYVAASIEAHLNQTYGDF
jgi:glycosyltransferase involved in cell wall biosynthesis